MSITLAVGGTSVNLPADLYWSDESWSPVSQTAQPTITGAIVMQAKQRLSGRPITLGPFDDTNAWTPKAVLDQVRAWAAVAGQQLTLTLRGVVHTVVLRHQDAPAIDAKPVLHFADVDGADSYRVTYKFMEIDE